VLAPVIVSGNTAVRRRQQGPAAARRDPHRVPGDLRRARRRRQRHHRRTAEIAPWLASHRDVNAIDLAGATDGSNAAATADGKAVTWADLERAAADNLKRVLRPAGSGAAAVEPDWAPTPDLSRMTAFLETKTVWHPKGR
jgi:hypothetical protein